MQKENLLKIGLIIVVFLLSVCLLSVLLIERKEEFDNTMPIIKKNNETYEEKTVEEIEKMIFGGSHKKKSESR